jgi:hypothetical protein
VRESQTDRGAPYQAEDMTWGQQRHSQARVNPASRQTVT